MRTNENLLVLDTETAGDISFPLPYDLGYKIINNQYFYVNKSDSTGMKNTFDVVYDKNVGQFNCGAAVNYNFREKVDFSFKIGYNKWSLEKQKEAWMLPAAQIGLGVSYVPTDFLRFNINYDLEAGRKAKLGKDSSVDLKNFNDISLGANYKLMSFLDVFARYFEPKKRVLVWLSIPRIQLFAWFDTDFLNQSLSHFSL